MAFFAFVLGRDPTRRIVCVSYSIELAKKHAHDCMAVMESARYKELFPRTRISQKNITDVRPVWIEGLPVVSDRGSFGMRLRRSRLEIS